MEIYFFNPKYHDLKAVGILFELQQFKDDNKWAEVGAQVTV